MGPGEPAGERWAAYSFRGFLSRARYSLDGAALRQVAANDVVFRVGDEHAVVAIDAEMLGAVEGGIDGGAPVSAVALFSGAIDHGANDPPAIHHPQSMAASLQNVEVPLPVRGSSPGIEQRRFRGHGAIGRKSLAAISRHRAGFVGGEIQGDHLQQIGDV